MELRQLRSFSVAYTAGSMTRAAEQLFLSQPALSRQIALLERECGARLLERGPAGVSPTPAGVALFRQARAILQLADAAPEVARDAGPSRESIEVGLAPGLPPEWIAQLIAAVMDQVSTATLLITDATSGEQLRMLRDGRLDLAVIHQVPPQGLDGTRLRVDEFGVALAPHAGWGPLKVARPADLDGVRLLAHARDQVSPTHDRLVNAIELAGARPLWQFSAYTENASACALATGAAASVQTRFSAGRLLPDWRWVPLVRPTVEMETWLVMSPFRRETAHRVASVIAAAAGS